MSEAGIGIIAIIIVGTLIIGITIAVIRRIKNK